MFQYSLAYAFLKFVNYSFFFWLPYYLNNEFGIPESEADQLSTWYDWGGIVGKLRVILGIPEEGCGKPDGCGNSLCNVLCNVVCGLLNRVK